MNRVEALNKYLLKLGDSSLIQGHRLSEWCSKGPILEEDLALTNMALDHIGRAQLLLDYAADCEGNGKTADDLAYKRAERNFYNPLITELPIGDFAYTMVKHFFVSAYEYFLYTELTESKDERLTGIAQKAIKETRYHLAHTNDWCMRLGKGTSESNSRMQTALDDLWAYTGELFEVHEEEKLLIAEGIIPNPKDFYQKWSDLVMETLRDAELIVPEVSYMHTGSHDGIHTEYLGHLLCEMQYLQRAYPDAKW